MSTIKDLLERHAEKGTKLTIRKISVDRSEPNDSAPAPIEDYALIEGDSDSLKFLGQFLIAFAEGDFGCSYDLHPKGAGRAHFTGKSDLGIDIHKIPCEFGGDS